MQAELSQAMPARPAGLTAHEQKIDRRIDELLAFAEGRRDQPLAALGLDIGTLANRCGWKLEPWQADIIENDHPRIVAVAPRQCGKSLSAALRALRTAMMQSHATVLIVAAVERQAIEMMRYCRRVIEQALGPMGIKIEETQTKLRLPNGSQIVALPGKNPKALLGYTAAGIVIDEAALVDDELMRTLVPMTDATGGWILMISTPRTRTGWLWKVWATEEGEAWHKIHLTIEASRLDNAELARRQRNWSPSQFANEYEALFVDGDASVFSLTAVKAALIDKPGCFVGPVLGRFPPETYRPLNMARIVDGIATEWRPAQIFVSLDYGLTQAFTALTIAELYLSQRESKLVVRWTEHTKGLSDDSIIARLGTIARLAAEGAKAPVSILVDVGGPGQVLRRVAQERGVPIRPIWIMPHGDITKPKNGVYRMAKADAVLGLRRMLDNGTVQICESAFEVEHLISEMLGLQETGNGMSFDAPSGLYDDMVMSLAMLVPFASKMMNFRVARRIPVKGY